MAKYRKIAVTGSSGVLGTGVKLISGNYPGSEFVFMTSKDCDLRDFNATLQAFERIKPDAILHIAAVSGGIGLSMKHQASMLRDISLMTFSILEAARKCKAAKTIMTLTTGMYPPDAPLPLKEEYMHMGYPHSSNYGSSFAKRLSGPAIRAYRDEYALNVIGLIPNGIFGEGDNFNFEHASMLPALIRRFYESRDLEGDIIVWGDGSPLREYTYGSDLAMAYMWALENYDDAQCLNIGSTEEHSIKDIAFMLADCMDIDRKRIKFDSSKPNGVFRKSTDNSRFLRSSQFVYTPFRIALEKTVKWFAETYRSNPDALKMHSKSK